MVAAHDWDVFGALKAGLKGAYIARKGKPYNTSYQRPNIFDSDLTSVTDRILKLDASAE